jgi:ParB family chromosome partitioning protein
MFRRITEMAKLNIEGATKSDIFFIPPEKITLGKNGRFFDHDETSINEMVERFEEEGQLQPVMVRRLSGDSVELVLGYRRCLAMIEYNKRHPEAPKKLKCTMVTCNAEEALRNNIVENIERKDCSVIDHAHNQRRLKEEHNWTDAQIAKLYKMSQGYVSQLRKLLVLPRPVQLLVHTKELPVSTAIKLADLPTEVMEEEVRKLLSQQEAPVEESEESAPEAPEAPTESKEETQAPEVKAPEAPTTPPKKTRGRKPNKATASINAAAAANGKPVAKTLKDVKFLLEGLLGCAESEKLRNVSLALLAFIRGRASDTATENLLREILPNLSIEDDEEEEVDPFEQFEEAEVEAK